MPPIKLLTKLGLLEGNKTVLDIGTKDGRVAIPFAELGLTVDAIDVRDPEQALPDISFERISVEDFLERNTKHYDIVTARHILPFTDNPLELIEKINNIAGVFMFSCFGPEDDWKDRDDIVFLNKEEIRSLFKQNQIRHYSETFEYGSTYTGVMKFWHIHTFVVDNRI